MGKEEGEWGRGEKKKIHSWRAHTHIHTENMQRPSAFHSKQAPMMQMYSQLSRNEYKFDNTFPSILLHAEKNIFRSSPRARVRWTPSPPTRIRKLLKTLTIKNWSEPAQYISAWFACSQEFCFSYNTIQLYCPRGEIHFEEVNTIKHKTSHGSFNFLLNNCS